ncbi:MAG: 3-dehydroquinate synthase [Schleiferiaceae bacterium]|nr:3-dehydroquinate synthase [Schleiferiaceae bacterium]
MRNWETPFGPVYVGKKAFQALDAWLLEHRETYSHVLILTDEHVHEACIPFILGSLSNLGETSILEIEAGESSKSMDLLGQLYLAMLDHQADRQSLVISIGGGVVTDLGGMLTSTFMRGVDHVLIPTSLLGMVDASIGGKTGVNVGGFKNLAGTFASSRGVFVQPDLLNSLPEAHWRAGWAECIKHAYLLGSPVWGEAKALSELDRLRTLLPTLMEAKIQRIQADPFEQGNERKALNLGHSMAHAAEAQLGPSLLHGDAVAAGLWLEFDIAESIGLCDYADVAAMKNIIDQWWPARLKLNEEMLNRLRGDKKNHAGTVRMALPGAPGASVTLTEVSESNIKKALASYASY